MTNQTNTRLTDDSPIADFVHGRHIYQDDRKARSFRSATACAGAVVSDCATGWTAWINSSDEYLDDWLRPLVNANENITIAELAKLWDESFA